MKLENVIKKFKIANKNVTYLERYGEGHINVTYLLIVEGGIKYIVQKINHHIFPDIDELMNNVNSVLEFLAKNSEGLNDPSREIMHIVPTEDNKLYFYDSEEDSYYRIYDFVVDSVTLQTITDASVFKESAVGFAKFALNLKDFDASKIYDVIPNFHNTKIRFEHFKKTLEKDACNRASSCEPEIKFVLEREKYVSKIVDKISEGKIPLRVTHNDTKLNNILFDSKTMKSLCVIDLDTIMKGSLLYDFGDSIRFGCNPAGENEKDLSKVVFNLDYFRAYTEGYLSQARVFMNDEEINNLAFSAILMTYECGLRFLDDYLDGDKYFNTKYQTHNLIRARTQFKLVSDMEARLDEMNEIVQKIASKM